MQATVTDDFDLILRWLDKGGESSVRFALVSNSEFTIAVRVHWDRGLHHQGETAISFQTMCYGRELQEFGVGLRKVHEGLTDSVCFQNTAGDFEIRIAPQGQEVRRVLQSRFRYRRFCPASREVTDDSELVLPVGPAEEILQSANAITEVIRLLKVDCRSLFELPEK